MPKQNNKSQKKVVQKEEEDHQIKETKATKAAQKKKTQPVVEESDGDDSQYYDGEEEGDITHPLNDPELNDDIYIPKKKTKKNNGEEAVTKKTNATKEIKAEGKRKGQAQKQPEPEPESEEEDVDEVEEDDDIVVEEQKESKKQQKKKNKAERFANQNKEATEVDIVIVASIFDNIIERSRLCWPLTLWSWRRWIERILLPIWWNFELESC
jgi:hypothetical protein